MLGNAREALLRIVSQICSELRRRQGRGPSGIRNSWGNHLYPDPSGLGPGDLEFIEAMRQALDELASSAGVTSLDPQGQQRVRAAIDGATLVVRGQLAIGSAEQLHPMLPSIVFLIVLPILQQDEALAVSHRTGELVAEAFTA